MGIKFENHDSSDEGFLGFDIIDGYCQVSLMTNWGNDIDYINRSLAPNALVADLEKARLIHQKLQKDYGDDPHVEGCRIISIYRLDENKSPEALKNEGEA